MSLLRLGSLAAVGLACLASFLVLHRTAPPRPLDVLDRVYG
ncbi:hypothetical protein RQM47_14745 [Rubrivirga sp. S365]|uniref:Uncharacterized protein n=1 Tax=Rubrivirga litoralis TaxID=3075598 RepID=A0ABU3BRD4_9BACT|nr:MULTISPECIES: hypothetical protein [unclassified Rubrivirga]MDT0631848.1 hypothetical protein [Rubrivirga sp. F394]MDT7857901.1 hypothetical protein [Rubrivirga sp. S365]